MLKHFLDKGRQWLLQKMPRANEAAKNPEQTNTATLKQQRLRVGVVLGSVCLMLGALFWATGQHVTKQPTVLHEEQVMFTSPLKVSTAKQQGIVALQQDLSQQTKRYDTLENSVDRLTHAFEGFTAFQASTEAKLHALQQQRFNPRSQETAQEREVSTKTVSSPPWQVSEIALSLRDKSAAPFVPAGSYVTAVLLSGVDVSAGVNAIADPKPVLLRTTAPIQLPNGKTLDVHNCRVIGASFGEVSSERAYIRLERLSCDTPTGWLDIPVYGYVAGADGKAGIRGHVVMRDKAMMSRAFMGGLVGGLGETLANHLTATQVNPLGTTLSVKAGDSLAYGAGKGVNQAASHMAEYYIKRAEQYQPVIQVLAGTTVDVVFHKGFSFAPTAEIGARSQASVPRAWQGVWRGEQVTGVEDATPPGLPAIAKLMSPLNNEEE
jgi:hypothetical protein